MRPAVNDYRLLLDRGYPETSVRELVGDRYRLPSAERRALYRGVSSTDHSAQRAARRETVQPADVQRFGIDGLNVLYTIAAYLLGIPVFVSTDGFVRDVAELHGDDLPTPILGRAAGLLVDAVSHDVGATVYLDRKADLAGGAGRLLEQEGPHLVVRVVTSADAALVSQGDGVIATSDTSVIDRATLPVLDMPAVVLRKRFQAELSDLRDLLVR
jgi:hypothetical protein